MQKLIIILSIFLLGLLIPAKAQISYEAGMKSALTEFYTALNTGQYDVAINEFGHLSKAYPDNWLPLYYSILTRTLKSFQLDTKKAIKESNLLEKEYDRLIELEPDMSETLTLRGLFRTVKLEKDPATYGMVLPSSVIADYNEAIKLNPQNPRPLYLLAQFSMKSAPFYGTDPTRSCPLIEVALQLFSQQQTDGFNPDWGENKANEILQSECVE